MRNKFLSLLLCFTLLLSVTIPSNLAFADSMEDIVADEMSETGSSTEEGDAEAVDEDATEEAGGEDLEEKDNENNNEVIQAGSETQVNPGEGQPANDNEPVVEEPAAGNDNGGSEEELPPQEEVPGEDQQPVENDPVEEVAGPVLPGEAAEDNQQTPVEEEPVEEVVEELPVENEEIQQGIQQEIPELQTPLAELPVEATLAETLYQQIMACETVEDFLAVYEAHSDLDTAAFRALFTDSELAELESHISSLTEVDLVEEVDEDEVLDVISNSDVAPFLPAVQGMLETVKEGIVSAFSYVVGVVKTMAVRIMSLGSDDNGIETSKTATKTGDNEYTITLDAYVTGELKIETSTTDKPADIVLVLDTSGSMANNNLVTTGDNIPLSDLNSTYGASGVYTVNYSYTAWGKKSSKSDKSIKYENGQWQVYHSVMGYSYWEKVSNFENFKLTKVSLTRMDALKISAKEFIDSVAAKSASTGVDHRIAIVTYASNSSIKKIKNGDKSALYSVSTQANVDGLKKIVNDMKAEGATRSDYGMNNAKSVISDIDDERKSNRVVILFTDGQPTEHSDFSATVANSTIGHSKDIKDAGASVYTIGVMSGADDTFPPSNFSNLSNFNKYMHLVSSNYPNATAMNATGARKSDTSSSFYLAAGNASRLNEIFQSIAQNIETGGVKATLGPTTVMKDVISDYFEIIPGSEKIYTAPYQGYNEDGSRKFGARTAYAGATVTKSADGKTVDVTGFDYSAKANCVMDTNNNGTMTYSGKKLIVELKVRAKGQFLGGNEVPTNENTSGLYKDGTTSVEMFEVPVVDVPVKTPLVNVTAADKNVYITGSLTKADLVSGAQVTCDIAGSSNKINLDLSAENFGLESWQNAYSTVTYQVKDANGVVVLDNESNRTDALRNLQDDTTYSLTVYITPVYSGTYTATNGSDTGNVNVFVPSMTFKDSNVWYGDVAPGDAYFASAGNRVGDTVWKHTATDGAVTNSTAVTMLGSKPALTYGYNIPSSVVSGGDNSIITTKADIPVTVTVNATPTGGSAVDITGKTTRTHQKCDAAEVITEGADFMLHVNTCSLTLSKSIGTNNPGADPDEDYIFKIAGPGLMGGSMEITLKKNETKTIAELPVGSYTITEDTHWSWRWAPSFSNGGTATLSKDNASARITCTNNSNGKTQWLNGYDNAVNHRGGSGSSSPSPNALGDMVMATSLFLEEEEEENGGEE